MTCPVDWSMCTVREERVFCYRCMECLQRSVKAVGPKGASKPSVSWLIFYLGDLSIFERGLLKSPTIIVLLFLSSGLLIFIYYKYI